MPLLCPVPSRTACVRSSVPPAFVVDIGTDASARVRRLGPPVRTTVRTGAAAFVFRGALAFRAFATFDVRVLDAAGARVLRAFFAAVFGARFAGMLDPRCDALLDEPVEERQQ